eukprot:TRINITY_DN530_c0_g1_i1.p1 TRINITY_DN530_c0_g1~~TRINITY_DN530_c0_g1_i1.p1  ORF type:complete len:142 (-),score=34.83 TRINITY_DN530_c0_g1_i1:114-539(-)
MYLQNMAILFLIFQYNKQPAFAFLSLLLTAVLLAVFPLGLVPFNIIMTLQAFTIPIFALSRIPQILANFKSKSTGQLALLTWLLNFAGAAARIFTTLNETNDPMLLVSHGIATVLNGTILVQILLYGDKGAATAQVEKKEK